MSVTCFLFFKHWKRAWTSESESMYMRKKRTQPRRTSARVSPAKKILKAFWFHIVFLILLVNYIVTRQIQLRYYAKNCISQDRVQSDARCLYTYFGNVYQKGTRNNPHQGNPCGSDVSTIIPSSHSHNIAEYLDPNLVGSLCSDEITPTPTSTPIPESTPTRTPTPTRVPPATSTPVSGGSQSTSTPTPTQQAVRTPTPTQQVKTPTPSPVPLIMSPDGSGFGKYIAGVPMAAPAIPAAMNNQAVKARENRINAVVLWSEILVAISFVLLIVVTVLGIVRKAWGAVPGKKS